MIKPRFTRACVCAMSLSVSGVFVLGATLIAQRPLEFEVASIRRNPSISAAGDTRRLPDGTVVATNVSIRNLLGLAWPAEDREYRNLPGWAIRNRYDITAKPPAGASPEQLRDMWRTLFKDRLQLEVHQEMRDTPVYALVVARADGRLGPQLKRSPHDCASLAAGPAPRLPTLPSDDEVRAGCGALYLQGRMIVGGTLLSSFAQSLGASGLVGRLVEDRTGLQGYYAFTLTYAPAGQPGADVPTDRGDAPSIFTALQEQLGLKLESARKPLQTVVIDRIEPPTEN